MLKTNPGTVLVFKYGKVVICAKSLYRLLETFIDFDVITGQSLSITEVQNVISKVVAGFNIYLNTYLEITPTSECEPELDLGAFVRFR